MSEKLIKSQADKIRAFFARHSNNPAANIPNYDMSFLTDEEVIAVYDNLIRELGDIMIALKRVRTTHPEIINTNSWIFEIVDLHEAILEDILLGS